MWTHTNKLLVSTRDISRNFSQIVFLLRIVYHQDSLLSQVQEHFCTPDKSFLRIKKLQLVRKSNFPLFLKNSTLSSNHPRLCIHDSCLYEVITVTLVHSPFLCPTDKDIRGSCTPRTQSFRSFFWWFSSFFYSFFFREQCLNVVIVNNLIIVFILKPLKSIIK